MGNPNKSSTLLDMFQHPVFRVKDGVVSEVNHTAEALGIKSGAPVDALLPHCLDAYRAYEGGCLSLTVATDCVSFIATVLRTEDGDVFHLRSQEATPELQMMTLAAQQLRGPLSEVMTAVEAVFEKEDIQDRQQIGLINRGLFRLLREIGNMSSIASYQKGRAYGKETRNIVGIINEIVKKASHLCSTSGQKLQYTALNDEIYCPVDTEMVERAIYNLISNAIKYSPANTPIIVKLSRKKDKLLFCVESQCTDKALTQGNLFMRYVRDASVEDGRHGLGLGIPLIQCAAAAHNGALLMDHPATDTVRFTLTLSTLSDRGSVLKAPYPTFDYIGGWDHGLVELSDVLPASAFENE